MASLVLASTNEKAAAEKRNVVSRTQMRTFLVLAFVRGILFSILPPASKMIRTFDLMPRIGTVFGISGSVCSR